MDGERLKLINKKDHWKQPWQKKSPGKNYWYLNDLLPIMTLTFKKLVVTRGDTTQATMKVNSTKNTYGAQVDKTGSSLSNNIHQNSLNTRVTLGTGATYDCKGE